MDQKVVNKRVAKRKRKLLRSTIFFTLSKLSCTTWMDFANHDKNCISKISFSLLFLIIYGYRCFLLWSTLAFILFYILRFSSKILRNVSCWTSNFVRGVLLTYCQVLHMRNKYRNRLDMNKTGGNVIRLKLTNLQPAWKSLQINIIARFTLVGTSCFFLKLSNFILQIHLHSFCFVITRFPAFISLALNCFKNKILFFRRRTN